jgi:hypothetical protein
LTSGGYPKHYRVVEEEEDVASANTKKGMEAVFGGHRPSSSTDSVELGGSGGYWPFKDKTCWEHVLILGNRGSLTGAPLSEVLKSKNRPRHLIVAHPSQLNWVNYSKMLQLFEQLEAIENRADVAKHISRSPGSASSAANKGGVGLNDNLGKSLLHSPVVEHDNRL